MEGLDEIISAARSRARLDAGTCHDLRHTCLTRLREAGMSIEALQAQAGHRCSKMTLVYARIFDDNVAEQYFKATQAVDVETTAADVSAGNLHAPRRIWGNGHCTGPADLDCRFQTICEGCGFYETGVEFIDILRRQRDDATSHADASRAKTYHELVRISTPQALGSPDHHRATTIFAVRELLIAINPDPDFRLDYLIRVPLGDGIVLRTAGTWPRTKALYCYPVPVSEWPTAPDIVERVPLRSCARRGAAIDIVADRFRENRSQLVFTTARGRDAVFWQSPRTRKQARPAVSLPSARAAGIAELKIVVDAHERYPYRFAGQQVRTTSQALPCGDYGIIIDGTLVAVVERKSMPDLISSLINGRLRYALAELASVPRAAVVVEDRYSQLYKQDRVRPALVADGIAECQVRWPNIPIVFCETRSLAEEWTYRYLAAAHSWASTETAALERIGPQRTPKPATIRSGPTPAELRSWARNHGIDTPERGRIPTSIRQAWEHSTVPQDPDINPPDVRG